MRIRRRKRTENPFLEATIVDIKMDNSFDRCLSIRNPCSLSMSLLYRSAYQFCLYTHTHTHTKRSLGLFTASSTPESVREAEEAREE